MQSVFIIITVFVNV